MSEESLLIPTPEESLLTPTPEAPLWATAVMAACSYDPNWLISTLSQLEQDTMGQEINAAVSRALGVVLMIPPPHVVGQAVQSYGPRVLNAINDPRNITRITEEERTAIINIVTEQALTFLSGKVQELTNLIGAFEV
jgi:hypothetical protein